jgi:hypothetical protein
MRFRHVRAAQPAGGGAWRPARCGRRAPAGGVDGTEVREWANAQGIDVRTADGCPLIWWPDSRRLNQGDGPVAGLWRLTHMVDMPVIVRHQDRAQCRCEGAVGLDLRSVRMACAGASG